MKPLNLKTTQAFIVGCILTIPGLYFIVISVLKYRFNQPYFYDAATPFLEQLGINESIVLNINLLILFGPVLACLLNTLSVLDIHFASGKDRISLQFSVSKSWRNMIVMICSSGALLLLFAYLIAENYICF